MATSSTTTTTIIKNKNKNKTLFTLSILSFLSLFVITLLISFTKRFLQPTTLSIYSSPPPSLSNSSSDSIVDSGGFEDEDTQLPIKEFENVSSITVVEGGDSGKNGGDVSSVVEERFEEWGKISCDLYVGNWVRDEEDYPIYKPGSCPYVDEAYDCQNNGRKDSDYLKWRWKPHGCELPRLCVQIPLLVLFLLNYDYCCFNHTKAIAFYNSNFD
ncbi:hypothetical protein CsSME_00008710 [Camellia sinensis var. sinensis]